MLTKFCLKTTSGIIAALALSSVAPSAVAADFPSKPIRLIVGFAPGGSNDIIARLLAPKLEAELKQSVIVENRPGASGNIAADAAIKSEQDGHTVFMCTTGTLSIQPFLPVTMPFKVTDITPVTQIANTPYLMVVSNSVPASTVAEFLTYAKENPSKVNFASSGNGSTAHLAGEMLRSMAGIDIVHVPYKGSGQAMVDLTSGRVSLMFDQAVSSQPYIQAGTLKALAVAGEQRLSGLPNIPTTAEAGLKNFNPTPWTGLCAGPGIPAQAVKTLQQAMTRVLADPEIQARFLRDGIEAVGSTPEQFAEFLKADREKWGGLVKTADIKL